MLGRANTDTIPKRRRAGALQNLADFLMLEVALTS